MEKKPKKIKLLPLLKPNPHSTENRAKTKYFCYNAKTPHQHTNPSEKDLTQHETTTQMKIVQPNAQDVRTAIPFGAKKCKKNDKILSFCIKIFFSSNANQIQSCVRL